MIWYDEIEKVLSKFEGRRVTKGYIPCNVFPKGTANYYGGPNPDKYDPMGISGVTIATGVDLGQTNSSTLKKIGVSNETIALLTPYLEKTKKNAVMALYKKPLDVSEKVAEELDTCMHRYHIKLIQNRYDKDAGAGAFESLPWQAQAVIVSILYQRGIGSPKKFQNTWNALVRKDWSDASVRLQNKLLWSGYQSRRAAEGKILSELA